MEDLTRLIVWIGSFMVFIAIFATKPFASIMESPVLIAILMILLVIYILFFVIEYKMTYKQHVSLVKKKYFDFSGNFLSLVVLILLLFIFQMPWYYVLLIISSLVIILTLYNFEKHNHH